jgi:phosphomannomutase / phosphoglucomutase
MNITKSIFKAYDIRGIVDTQLTTDAARGIGAALGTLALEKQCNTIVVGRDGRLSGPKLSHALIEGIASTGCNVIDIGVVATPMTYFGAYHYNTKCSVMVTGSHNPPDYNGLKMVIAGDTLALETIEDLYQRVSTDAFTKAATPGKVEQRDIASDYQNRIIGDIKLTRPMKIAVDCGNGSPGAFAGKLFRALGCTVDELFCDVDGNFPNHHPDPSKPENLRDLIAHVKSTDCELGLAFDGDGDRLGVVTKEGNIIYPDRQLMLFAADVLSRNPGAEIIYDVKCTRNLAPWISARGGKPLMWKTGHSLIKSKMKETGAPLAGEMSGHMFFKERWYGFDDGLYSGARLLEVLARDANPSATLNALPDATSTPELNWKLAEGEPHAIIAALQQQVASGANLFASAEKIVQVDGLRVEYADGFGLARASNTTPVIVLRFEANSDAALARIMSDFKAVLQPQKPDKSLPY